jgi:hypothetical protein
MVENKMGKKIQTNWKVIMEVNIHYLLTSTSFVKWMASQDNFYTITPHHNGVSKWKNWIIVEVILIMVYDVEVLKAFWREALLTIAYLQNKQYKKTIDYLSPYELWIGVN